MTRVIVLPPNDAPHRVTAQYRPQNLYEHFLAFLNANNPHGFSIGEVQTLDPAKIGDLMVLSAERESLNIQDFKEIAWSIKKLSDGAIKVMRAYDLVSALFGYQNWYHSKIEFDKHNILNNLRKNGQINAKVYRS